MPALKPLDVTMLEKTRPELEELLKLAFLAKRPNVFRGVAIHLWIDGTLPSPKRFEGWIKADKYPDSNKAWASMRRLFAFNGIPITFDIRDIKFGTHPLSTDDPFPWERTMTLSTEQLAWTKAMFKCGKGHHSLCQINNYLEEIDPSTQYPDVHNYGDIPTLDSGVYDHSNEPHHATDTQQPGQPTTETVTEPTMSDLSNYPNASDTNYLLNVEGVKIQYSIALLAESEGRTAALDAVSGIWGFVVGDAPTEHPKLKFGTIAQVRRGNLNITDIYFIHARNPQDIQWIGTDKEPIPAIENSTLCGRHPDYTVRKPAGPIERREYRPFSAGVREPMLHRPSKTPSRANDRLVKIDATVRKISTQVVILEKGSGHVYPMYWDKNLMEPITKLPDELGMSGGEWVIDNRGGPVMPLVHRATGTSVYLSQKMYTRFLIDIPDTQLVAGIIRKVDGLLQDAIYGVNGEVLPMPHETLGRLIANV